MNGIGALIRDLQDTPSAFHHVRIQGKDSQPHANQHEGPHQIPTTLTPWTQNSSHQSCERYIFVVHKPPNVCFLFVIAARTNEDCRVEYKDSTGPWG